MKNFYLYLLLFIASVFSMEYANAQTVVTPSSAPTAMCAASPGYTTLGTIYIAETAIANFTQGAGLTYIISVPNANFEFNTGVTPTVTTNAGSGITAIVASAPTTSTFTITFTVSAASETAPLLDSLRITNLQVRAITTGSTGNITRSGGTAVMAGNTIADAQNHCTLNSISGVAITANPVDEIVCEGEDATYTVVATGAGTLSYVWERDNNDGSFEDAPGAFYNGELTATITAPNVDQSDQNNFLFRCRVTSSTCGSATSASGLLTIVDPVNVTSNPPNRSICSGSGTTFGITASDATSYQWQVDPNTGVFANVPASAPYSGTTSATLTISNVAGLNNYKYRCIASNSGCSDNSNQGTLTVNTVPVISSHPVDRITCVNDDPTFSVTATGSPVPTYSWTRYNGTSWGMPGGSPDPYSDEDEATMTANNVAATQNGYLFKCTVSNTCGSVESDTVALTVHSTASVNYFGLSSTYCRNAVIDTLDGFPTTGVFSGPGVTNLGGGKGIFNPLTAGTSGSKTVVYTLGCAINKNATVYDTTNMAFTSPSASSFSSNDPAVDLEVQAVPSSVTLGGTFTGNGVTGTKFYPNLATAGLTHPITFSFTNSNGCVSKTVKPITVTSATLGIPQLRNGGKAFCQGGATIMLSDTSVDGDTPVWGPDQAFAGFTGPGISDLGSGIYEFSPDSVGTYTIYYRKSVRIYLGFGYFWFTVNHASQSVTVKAPTKDISFTLPASACSTSSSFDMAPTHGLLSMGSTMSVIYSSTGDIPSGLLSGTNDKDFNPSASEEVSTIYTVRYTYVNSDGCTSTLDKQINVFPKPDYPTLISPTSFWGAQDETYCLGNTPKYVGAVYSSTINYDWYNDVSLASGAKISDIYYMPPQLLDNEAETYTYYVTQTIGGCTSEALPVTVTFNDRPKVIVGSPQTICENNTITLTGTSNLTSGLPVSATWSSPTSGSFNNPATLGAIYTPSAADISNGGVDLKLKSIDPSGPCPADSASVRMTINRAASVYAGPDKTYCSNSSIILSGSKSGSANDIQWKHSLSGTTANITNPTSLSAEYEPTGSDKNGAILSFTLESEDPDGPSGPCGIASDVVQITIDPEVIIDAGIDQALCRSASGSTVFNLNAQCKLNGSSTNFPTSWSGGLGAYSGISSLVSTYTPNTAEIPENGSLSNTIKLVLTSDDPVGPCTVAEDSLFVTINPLPRIDSVIVPKVDFCKTEPLFQIRIVAITKSGTKSDKYLDPIASNTGVSGSNFIPNIANPGPHTIRYEMIDNNNCYNYRDTSIYVYKVPEPVMTISKFCATTPTIFDGSNSDFPSVVNDNDNVSQIDSYLWKFGYYNSNNEEDSSTLEVTDYSYPKTFNPLAKQNYTVSLTVTTDQGCFAEKTKSIVVGNIPEADFSWTGICPVDVTSYKDLSNFPIAEVASYTWNFDTESTKIGSTISEKNPNYKFIDGTGIYDVKFKIVSKLDCKDSITQKVNILDHYRPTYIDPYAKNFGDPISGHNFWSVDGTNPSWQWGPANKDSIKSNRKVWVTDTINSHNVSENSNLNGPCLNLDALERPMIALKIWSASRSDFSGAVLQSSLDGGVTWNVIGDLETGMNWYSHFGISGDPGEQKNGLNKGYGWSGADSEWKVAKVGLNGLYKQNPVRIRIAFGSSSDPSLAFVRDGFAIDSVWIGERDKLLLVENFTNSTSSAASASDANLNSLVDSRSSDVVAIHYHTGFPGSDPMNLRNQANPSSRVLNYGVPSVPYKVLEGNYDYGTTLDANDIDRRSLEGAKFKIKINTTLTGSSYTVNANVIANETVSNDFVVHVAAIERKAVVGSNTYQWVLTRMLPNAAGTFFNQTFNKNDSTSISESWNYLPGEIYDTSKLGVIVFVQDLVTNEIYQTAYVKPGESNNTIIIPPTGLKHDLLAGKEVYVYPNPADYSTSIVFEGSTDEDYIYQVYDELGKVVANGQAEPGVKEITLSTAEFANGLYVIRIGNSMDGFAYKKLVVSH